MYFIEVPDMNDSMSEFSVDGEVYLLRFTYNSVGDYWSFGIYDIFENPIIAMTRIVPNYPIFEWYTYSDLPDGIFGCLSDNDKIGRASCRERV